MYTPPLNLQSTTQRPPKLDVAPWLFCVRLVDEIRHVHSDTETLWLHDSPQIPFYLSIRPLGRHYLIHLCI